MVSNRGTLTRDRIVDAAIAIADESGVGAVSMRQVATALRVEAMSLYRHVGGKDDLLDAMLDRVIGGFPSPATDTDWRDALTGLAQGSHRVLMSRPWSLELAATRPAIGPQRLRFIDGVLGILLGAGAAGQLAHDAMHAVNAHVFGFSREEYLLQSRGLDGRGPDLDELRRGGGTGQYPHIAATIAGVTHDHYAEYSVVLSFLLDGIEASLERQ